jgi:hypothetical protein
MSEYQKGIVDELQYSILPHIEDTEQALDESPDDEYLQEVLENLEAMRTRLLEEVEGYTEPLS